ncbi:MAG: class I SAM-dependent methyltransferase [Polyangiales bacterium]
MRRAAMWFPSVLMACSGPAAHVPPREGHGHHHATSPSRAHGGHHGFGDVQRWSATFDDPARDAWQRPDEVIRALSLAPDARVADIGAGTGYFSVRIAPLVPQGRVWAVDLEPALLRHVRERAASGRINNLFPVLATPTDAMIPERVDVVLVVDTYHHIEGRTEYFRGLTTSLRPGGRVVIVDYTREAPEGPPPEMRLTPEQVDAEMTAAGYERVGDIASLPRQYMVTYRPRAVSAPAPR